MPKCERVLYVRIFFTQTRRFTGPGKRGSRSSSVPPEKYRFTRAVFRVIYLAVLFNIVKHNRAL